MPTTVTRIVTDAYYASGIVSRDFETLEGGQLNLGVRALDSLLSLKLIDDKAVPYFQSYTFNAVIGQEAYPIPNLISADTFTFNIGDVRYSTQPENRTNYFGSTRANNVNSLPYKWHIERSLGGATLYMYFSPDVAYPCELWGVFGLVETTSITQDLELTYDVYYIDFLKFELAERLCTEYEFEVPTGVQRTLMKYRNIINKKSAPLDLVLQNKSTLSKNNNLNYADVNLGRGWH